MSLATNGTLLTGEWLEKLKEAGLNAVLFDIQPGDHEKIAGRPGNKKHIVELIPKAIPIAASRNQIVGANWISNTMVYRKRVVSSQ